VKAALHEALQASQRPCQYPWRWSGLFHPGLLRSERSLLRWDCWKARLRSWRMRVVEVFILLIDLCLCIHDLQQVSGLKIQHSHHSLQLMITSHPDWYLLRQSSMLPGHPDGQDSIIVLEDSSAAFQEAEQGDIGLARSPRRLPRTRQS